MPECPSSQDLEEFVAGQGPAPVIGAHLESCAACRAAADEIRRNRTFMAQVVALEWRPTGGGRDSESPDDPTVFESVHGYDIQSIIDRGGQGAVYKAVQKATKRTVALKVLLGGALASDGQRRRFEREIELAASLRHPHIVTVHDSGMTRDGRLYYAMEYVEGRPLDVWVARCGIRAADLSVTAQSTGASKDRSRAIRASKSSAESLLRLFARICDAVNDAHQRGILHRDLKPANIMVDSAGEPRILDFGLAKALGSDTLTRSRAASVAGEFLGTLAYAAPEQVKGVPDQIDTRTDVYALGVILYEALAGRLPYPTAASLADGVRNIIATEPARPSAHRPWIDGELDTIVLKALAKDKDRRYQSARELGLDLERHMAGEPIAARSDSAWYLLRKATRRYRIPILAAVSFLVLIVVFAVAMTIQAGRLARQRDEARHQRSLAEIRLSQSNIESGRLMGMANNLPIAEGLLWPEFLHSPNTGATESTRPDTDSHAGWALRELYSRQPCRLTLPAHPGGAGPAVFSATGDTLVSYGEDGQIKQWELSSGRLLHGEPIARGRKLWVSFSADGQLIAYGDQEGRVMLMDCTTWKPRFRLDGGSSAIRCVALSPNGQTLASGRLDGSIQLWDALSGRSLGSLDGFAGPVRNLCFSPDGRKLASVGGNEPTVHLWDVATPQLHEILGFASPHSSSLCFSPDGSEVGFIRHQTDELLWWQVARGQTRTPTAEHRMLISTLGHSPDGRLLAIGGTNGIVQLLDVDSEQWVASYAGHTGGVSWIDFSPDGRLIATASVDGLIRIWDAPPYRHTHALAGHSNTVLAVQFDREDSIWASASADETVRLWEPSTGVCLAVLGPHHSAAAAAAFHPKDRIIATGGYDGLVRLWDSPSGHLRNSFPAGVEKVASVAFSPDGRTLATSGEGYVVNLWDVTAEPRLLKHFMAHTGRIPMVQFSPDGRLLASCSRDRSIILWDVASGQVRSVWRDHQGAVRSVQFSPDGNLLVSSSDDWTVKLWEVASGRCLRTLGGHNGQVYAAGFSPDGKLLASGDQSGRIKVWEVSTGEALMALEAGAVVFSLAFSPDGSAIASGGEGSEPLRIWDLTYYNTHILGNLEYQIGRSPEQSR